MKINIYYEPDLKENHIDLHYNEEDAEFIENDLQEAIKKLVIEKVLTEDWSMANFRCIVTLYWNGSNMRDYGFDEMCGYCYNKNDSFECKVTEPLTSKYKW